MASYIDSARSIILDTARMSSALNGTYFFQFPRSGIPTEGYFKVSAVYLRGVVPSTAYLQLRSTELGDATFALCTDNEFDFRTKVIAITPAVQAYGDARAIWRKYGTLQTNVLSMSLVTADNAVITDGWCVQLEFKPASQR